jgi:hypothetical protein
MVLKTYESSVVVTYDGKLARNIVRNKMEYSAPYWLIFMIH